MSRTGTRTLELPHAMQWQFDALRGNHLFLIRFLATGGYQVLLYHLDTGKLDAQPLKDPHESGTIWGSPFSRLASSDGRYLFTLYIASNGGAMIHELDLKAATARCIDLPGTGDYGSATSWALVLSKDGRTLRAVSPGYGRVVSIDVRSRKVSDAFRIDLPNWNPLAARGPRSHRTAARSRSRMARPCAIVDLAARRIADRTKSRKTIALGYSPDGTTLWRLS